jgi:hypothetical protein
LLFYLQLLGESRCFRLHVLHLLRLFFGLSFGFLPLTDLHIQHLVHAGNLIPLARKFRLKSR